MEELFTVEISGGCALPISTMLALEPEKRAPAKFDSILHQDVLIPTGTASSIPISGSQPVGTPLFLPVMMDDFTSRPRLSSTSVWLTQNPHTDVEIYPRLYHVPHRLPRYSGKIRLGTHGIPSHAYTTRPGHRFPSSSLFSRLPTNRDSVQQQQEQHQQQHHEKKNKTLTGRPADLAQCTAQTYVLDTEYGPGGGSQWGRDGTESGVRVYWMSLNKAPVQQAHITQWDAYLNPDAMPFVRRLEGWGQDREACEELMQSPVFAAAVLEIDRLRETNSNLLTIIKAQDRVLEGVPASSAGDLEAPLAGSAGHVRDNDGLAAEIRGQIDRQTSEASSRPESPSPEERGSFRRRKVIVVKLRLRWVSDAPRKAGGA
ncbi:hypothetical protein DL771_008221 [Monosporascus sp. 5C6A]|nr:hypothetical protein DL771_008221 [Monosporascus sp. 5C6A]